MLESWARLRSTADQILVGGGILHVHMYNLASAAQLLQLPAAGLSVQAEQGLRPSTADRNLLHELADKRSSLAPEQTPHLTTLPLRT